MIELPREDDDACASHALVTNVVRGMLETVGPSQLYLVKLDQWFDWKWLEFSYKKLGAIAVWQHRPLTLPPFHPNRVRWQRHYTYDAAAGDFLHDGPGHRLHISQPSESNARRTLDYATFDSAAIVWFSGSTARLNHGSLMVYYNTPDEDTEYVWTSGWYASLPQRDGKWFVGRTKGVSPGVVQRFLDTGRSLGQHPT